MAGCWEFDGARTKAGYGNVMINGRNEYVHRLVYEVLVGPLIPGLVIDHLCRNRACYNPAHLEQVTVQENLNRSVVPGKLKDHCFRGHPFTPDNVLPRKRGRTCRECQRQSSLRSRARKKEVS